MTLYALRPVSSDSPGLRRGNAVMVPGVAIREACPDLTDRERLSLLTLPVGECHHLQLAGRNWCMERVS